MTGVTGFFTDKKSNALSCHRNHKTLYVLGLPAESLYADFSA